MPTLTGHAGDFAAVTPLRAACPDRQSAKNAFCFSVSSDEDADAKDCEGVDAGVGGTLAGAATKAASVSW